MNPSVNPLPVLNKPPTTSSRDAYHFTERPESSLVATTASPSIVHTVESVSEGRTIFVTVTRYSTPTAQPSTSPTLVTDLPPKKDVPAGPIAGGVVGGLAVLALALFLLLFYRRKRRVVERKRASLPPAYTVGDMSEQLAMGSLRSLSQDNQRKLSMMP